MRTSPGHLIRPAFVALAAALALGVGLVGARAARAEGTLRGCPYTEVCIYPHAGWNNNHPSIAFRPSFARTDHDWFNLHDEYGIHRVFYNNDSWICVTPHDGFCFGYHFFAFLNGGHNGAPPVDDNLDGGQSKDVNLTPINSITIFADSD